MKLKYYILNISIAVITITVLTTSTAQALFTVVLPDCSIYPEHPFCAGYCLWTEPTPLECPEPEPERDPVILIPGIVTSQNKNVLYLNEQGGQWKFAFFFNVYRNLITKLEQNGYQQGKDLIIAHYDWRQPNAESAQEYLLPAIQQAKENTGASKVDIIAHSMGGLVAGAYIQSDEYGDDVDQFITLGTPHAGAANAYVAWEGGEYPITWKGAIRHRFSAVEESLKKVHNQQNLTRPASIRTFFPSVRELLPIDAFTKRNNEYIARSELAEQNPFLQNIYNTLNNIFDIDITTIAGDNKETIQSINLTNIRTQEDERLDRWRDGHPNPDPPQVNTNEGDSTVLVESAHIGENNITINAEHAKIPNKAADQVIEILGLDEVPEQFEYEPPTRIFGLTILSPIDAVIEGPNGEILSNNQNDFDNAEYDDDPNDPDDPKIITIADPPKGEYIITYTGAGEGEYTIITTYADEDETISSTQSGETTLGDVKTETITVKEESISVVDDYDIEGLLNQIIALAKQQKKNKVIKGRDEHRIKHPAKKAMKEFQRYGKEIEKELQNKKNKTDKHLKSYHKHLVKLEEGINKVSKRTDTSELLLILEKIKIHSPAL